MRWGGVSAGRWRSGRVGAPVLLLCAVYFSIIIFVGVHVDAAGVGVRCDYEKKYQTYIHTCDTLHRRRSRLLPSHISDKHCFLIL